jgi:hypothetical protein
MRYESSEVRKRNNPMGYRWILLAGGCLVLPFLAAFGCGRASPQPAAKSEDALKIEAESPEQPTLSETAPPPGLPIVAWGPRDSFPVIRKPFFVSARQGDTELATDEPVLGLVLDGEARAYSTNQLNRHEMVVDQVGDTPILVTY